LIYFLQQMPTSDSNDQVKRIINILELCPTSARFKDQEGMSALHYYFMRGRGFLEFPILHKLLDCYPEAPMVPNSLGETPLLQLVGQSQPCVYAIRVITQCCPQAFR
jgi:hypothetical protein